MEIDRLRSRRAALLARIASGERWTRATRREHAILTAGILALEHKMKVAA